MRASIGSMVAPHLPARETLILVGLGLAAVFELSAPAPARGWVYGGSAGTAGAVSIPQVGFADIFQPTGWVPNLWVPSSTWAPQFTIVSSTGPIVARSPATDEDQHVLGIYALEKWDGASWVQVRTQASQVIIPSGQASVYLQPLNLAPNLGPVPVPGYYRVSWAFAWAVPGTGAQYGNTVVVSNLASDFACVTQSRPCQVAAGYVQVGRAFMLGGGW